MPTADNSSSYTTQKKKEKTLANFHRLNPQAREGGSNTFSHTFLISRIAGQSLPDCCPAEPLCTLGTIRNFVAVFNDNVEGLPYYPDYNIFFNLTWNPLPFATSYTITSNFETDLVVKTGTTSATVYILGSGDYTSDRLFTLTVNTSCGSASATVPAFPCFLAGSLVHMSDGSTKCIEDILVGDQLVGAFGEINTVLALHRPLLGKAQMCTINNEHSTTTHHPHISLNKRFYCGNPEAVLKSTYGLKHTVIDADGNPVERMLYGLNKERILPLGLGIELKTVEGSRIVKILETYSMPEDTQLYNLVMSGSHTYHVDGYAVTGWPNEQDFDYDTWTMRN